MENKEGAADVLGWKAEEAEALLRSSHWRVCIVSSAPPGRQPPEGPLRVIRQQTRGDAQVLTVCRVPDLYAEN